MIYEVIQTITDGLNVFFKTRLRTNEDKAVISSIMNQDGSVAQLEENKVLITLVNIEKEPTPVGPKKDGKQRVHINFFVLFSCYFSNANYGEALKFLAFTMNYLNDNSSMDVSETGGAKSTSSSNGLKVQIEIESLTIDQNSNLWSTVGAKYMPSALYKIRMIPLDSNSLTEFRPSASSVSSNTKQTGGGTNTQDTGNTANTDSGSSQTSNNAASEPPSTPANASSTDPEKNKGKRPLTLAGALLFGDDDENDDNQDQSETTNAAVENDTPQQNDSNIQKGDLSNTFRDEQVKEDNPVNYRNSEDAGLTDGGERGDRDDEGDDPKQMNQSKKNSGSFINPFSPLKKPGISNVKSPENDINKASNDIANEGPNTNPNSDADKK